MSSGAQTPVTAARATALFRPPLAGIDLLAWSRFDESTELGDRDACSAIRASPPAGST